eukprot:TRINITY_DN67954_c5_g5_i2.p2 TRINITY_DN67954_c5_g5~~TRINITY_DN67954_c5_g5_i2.p2  ORF type:complete len:149 (-),score=14.45 TRINITY_DN67954_c5_g5_i2:325-771(-)
MGYAINHPQVHYHFVDKAEFERLLSAGCFIEHANVHGNYYGTSKQALESLNNKGISCILDIDVQGCQQVVDAQLNAKTIFIKPPSLQGLEARLRARGTESEEKIQTRMQTTKREMELVESNPNGLFNTIIVNDDLDIAFDQFRKAVLC